MAIEVRYAARAVAVADGGGTVAVMVIGWGGWSGASRPAVKTSWSTIAAFVVVGLLLCLAEAGEASLERVLRNVDFRFGGRGRLSGRSGMECAWRSL